MPACSAVKANPAWKSFEGKQRRDFAADQASVAAVTADLGPEVPGRNYLSLYCHGIHNPTEPEASGLELADGWLTMQVLRSLLLDSVRLAFLGACKSGLVGLALADEHIGLPVALLEAQIPAVAASHWPVLADATRILAEAFFTLVLHDPIMTPAQALRRAQLGMLDAALGAYRHSRHRRLFLPSSRCLPRAAR